MKKLLYGFVFTFFLLIVVIVYAANSSYVIQKGVDMFAPDYHISYGKISGNLFTGVTIEALHYEQKPLVKKVKFRWNPSALLYKRVAVQTLEIESLNIDVLKALIASLPAKEEKEDTPSEPMEIKVVLDHFALSVEPFKESGILVEKTNLKAKGISYRSTELEIADLDLEVDSNITQIGLQGSVKKGQVELRKVICKNINFLEVHKIVDRQNSKADEKSASDRQAGNKEPNPLLPVHVVIESLEANLKPFNYAPVELNSFVLNVKELYIDLQNLLAKKGQITVEAETNLSHLSFKSNIKDNVLEGETVLSPHQALFDIYKLPLRREAIETLKIGLNVSEKHVRANLNTKAKQILVTEKKDTNETGSLNIDIDTLLSHVVYDTTQNRLKAETEVIVTTPYAKDIKIRNSFVMDKNISYSGKVTVGKWIGFEENLTKPLTNLVIRYEGGLKKMEANISSASLSGNFRSKNFEKGHFHLKTDQNVQLDQMVVLPQELKGAFLGFSVDAPLDLTGDSTVKAEVKLTSNVINANATLAYHDRLSVMMTTIIPQDSLLKKFDKNVKWNNIETIQWAFSLEGNHTRLQFHSDTFGGDLGYSLEESDVKGKIDVGSSGIHLRGNLNKTLEIQTQSSSVKTLLDNAEKLYALQGIPSVSGALDLSIKVNEAKQASLTLRSPLLVYKEKDKEETLRDLKVVAEMNASQILLKEYHLKYGETELFSTKPSRVEYKEGTIMVSPFWLNDKLEAVGKYDVLTQKGSVTLKADDFKVNHETIELNNNLEIEAAIDGNKTSVIGKVVLLGGKIRYDLEQKSFASDSDIVMLQEVQKKQQNPFMKNLSTAVQIETKEPLVYKQKAIDIKAKVGLAIHKVEQGELMVLGAVELLEGGSYIFEDKRFVFDKSFVYFTGDPNKPMLEISVKYKSLNHLITILVTGTPDAPNINFSSKPYLTREQILSVILFDTEGAAGTNSGEEMMKMMGGAMAKSALSNMGIKLDHLVLGEGNSVEIGKKLTNKITIIYVNDEVSSVKLKYEHTKRTESVIGVNEESQSYDIIYKKDFKTFGF